MPGFLAGELWKPENRKYHLLLKTATNLGVPPSLLMEQGKTKPVWTEKDKKLVMAWQQYQDDLCPKCGIPRWIGHAEIETIDFEEHTTICYSCGFLEEKAEKSKTPVPKGGTRYVTPVPVEGEELPTREQGYANSQ